MKHIFWPEVDVKILENGKFSKIDLAGFHHDHLGLLEKSGKIKLINKKVLPNGLIQAQVKFDKYVSKVKTFFPQDWSRQQVIEKINEALQNEIEVRNIYNKANEIIQKEITGLTTEKIKIKIIIEKSNTVISPHPHMDNFK